MAKHQVRYWFAISLFISLLSIHSLAFAQNDKKSKKQLDNAVILQYHHVAANTPAITSTRPDVFAEHMAYLAEHYHVMPLKAMIEALQSGQKLPDKTIAITFDDGYANIIENAHPIMAQYGFPYTVFVNPPAIGVARNQLTWEEIEIMEKQGADFANHTLDHLHMLNRLDNESDEAWLDRVVRNVEEAERQLTEKIGYSLKYLAYPFGEYNTELKNTLTERGYVSFAQYSGGVASFSDFGAIPRFPAGGRYANLNTLKTKLASLAFPVLSNSISDPVVVDPMPTSMSLTLDNKDFYMSMVSCFWQGERIQTTRDGNVLTIPLPEQFPTGRSRINCTAPSKKHTGRFYWYSQPFFKARADGSFPD
ncbi:polysaccharide deacetylase family protein [Alteromonas sp. LMIT006]|uniref:polysaccharide deacetylase family protein n=1 Tax=Alteromonadaceae TaxID=72275 RepID=UPI0020CA5D32|nr:polysaccharide deacetylase family protein [Alteromonas sp. LMIT006]UTP73135.1 polysaccharide deacetylase family protein [Alteromonas sp. LMIT006]